MRFSCHGRQLSITKYHHFKGRNSTILKQFIYLGYPIRPFSLLRTKRNRIDNRQSLGGRHPAGVGQWILGKQPHLYLLSQTRQHRPGLGLRLFDNHTIGIFGTHRIGIIKQENHMTVGLISIGGTTTRHRKGENQTGDGHHASEQNNPMLNLLLLPSMLQSLN